MKKLKTILLIGALLATAFLGVFAEISKGYAENAEQILKEGRQRLELLEKTRSEIKEDAQRAAAEVARVRHDEREVQAQLQDCKTGK